MCSCVEELFYLLITTKTNSNIDHVLFFSQQQHCY